MIFKRIDANVSEQYRPLSYHVELSSVTNFIPYWIRNSAFDFVQMLLARVPPPS